MTSPRISSDNSATAFQHALRAFTARDRKALQRASETYRPNPRFETVDAIRDVGVGEAVTSMLEEKGVPGIVERTLIRPPSSKLGPASTDATRRNGHGGLARVKGKYDDRARPASRPMKSSPRRAAEGLANRRKQAEEEPWTSMSPAEREFNAGRRYSGKRACGRSTSGGAVKTGVSAGSIRRCHRPTSVIKEMKGTTGRRIVRGILGGLFKGR